MSSASAEYLARNSPSAPKTNAEFSDSLPAEASAQAGPFFRTPYLTGRLQAAGSIHYLLALIVPDDITSVIKLIVNNGYLDNGRPKHR